MQARGNNSVRNVLIDLTFTNAQILLEYKCKKCKIEPFKRSMLRITNVVESMETCFFTEFLEKCIFIKITTDFLQFLNQKTIYKFVRIF